MERVSSRNPGQNEFLQAVREVMSHVLPFTQAHPRYRTQGLLDRLTEPDRVVSFRVTWEDDAGDVHINRGWRVQFNNSIGPYKGGLRFHPTVTESVLKFLAFEQIFKNSLTGLPMGGGKGGSDFNPRGKSEREVMRFCQAFMTELTRYIGEDTDVPAGDIGVGGREVGFLFGQFKRLQGRFVGVLTGKGPSFGGSLLRPEATGYGATYMMGHALAERGLSFEGKRVAVSGAGNVALHAIEKLIALGATVVTASDSNGAIYDPQGFDQNKVQWLKELKLQRRGRIHEYASHFEGVEYFEGQRPWHIPVDLAFPSATQNELDLNDAKALVANGLLGVSEGANMPSTAEAIAHIQQSGAIFLPGKAANAGGVAVSGLEQSQNSLRGSWSRDDVDRRLREIMANIHQQCVTFGTHTDGSLDYLKGANIAGFVKVADATLAQGLI